MARRYDERNRMRNSRIEQYADEMIAKYLHKYKGSLKVPVPVVEMLDCVWDFYVETDDLQKEYGEGTHGALFINDGERRIAIDKTIDPEAFPQMRGRYNFSVAHEAGHWVIHAPELLAAETTPDFLPERGKPTILCRSSHRDERERQADRFAGYLTMPRDLIRDKWYEKYGENSKAVNVFDELEELRGRLGDARKVFCRIAHDFASVFAVSPEAMQIRLSELGFIKLEEDNQMELF